jgi:hypothetical protein
VTFAAARPQNASATHAQQATNRVFFTAVPFSLGDVGCHAGRRRA